MIESTRQQDAYAEQLAEDAPKVACRMLNDGTMAVTPMKATGERVLGGTRIIDRAGERVDHLERTDAFRQQGTALVERATREGFGDMVALRSQMAALASDALAAYPQYDDAFQHVGFGILTRRSETKGGLVGERGEPVLVVKRDHHPDEGIPGTLTVFSLRRMTHVLQPKSAVRVLVEAR